MTALKKADNVQIVKTFFERQYAGDFDGAFELASPDFSFAVASRGDAELNAAIPWAGTILNGRNGYRAMTDKLFGEYDVESFEIQHYLDGGDRVIVEGHFRFRHKGTRRIADSDFLARFDMRDGKVAGGQFYENTLAVAASRRDLTEGETS